MASLQRLAADSRASAQTCGSAAVLPHSPRPAPAARRPAGAPQKAAAQRRPSPDPAAASPRAARASQRRKVQGGRPAVGQEKLPRGGQARMQAAGSTGAAERQAVELCNSWQQEQLQASLARLDAKLQQLSVKLHGGTHGQACTHCLVAVLHQSDADPSRLVVPAHQLGIVYIACSYQLANNIHFRSGPTQAHF